MATGDVTYNPPLSGDDWLNKHLRRATAYAAISATGLDYWHNSFAKSGAGYATSTIAGAAAFTHLPQDGGSIQTASSATANSDGLLHNQDFQVAAIKTKKWYIAARAKIGGATDAQANLSLVSIANGGTPTEFCDLHVTNGVLTLTVTNGTPTNVTTTWTVDTAAAHDFAVSFDLVTVRAYVDGLEVGSTATLTNMSTATGYWGARARNGTTASDRSFITYAALMALEMV